LTVGEANTIKNREMKAHSAEEVKEEVKETPFSLEVKGDRQAGTGDWLSAAFHYNRALPLAGEKDKPRLLAKMAQTYLRGQQWAQAEAAFNTLTESKPDDASAWQGLGLARLALSQPDPAQVALTRALALNPKLWPSLNGLGILANWQGQPRQAQGYFEKALLLEPNSAVLHNNRGLSFLLQDLLERAEASFRRALALNPNYPLAANNLGLALTRQGKDREALLAFGRAVGQAEAHNNLGCLMAWQGKLPEAAEQFRTAQRSKPNYYDLATRHLSQVQGPAK
jgi:tetratricopeptide (TPR) repeat protein